LLESFCEGRLFAERIGAAPADVVGLHGWARTREDLTGLLAGFNAVVFDLPGFGASPPPPEAWDSAAYATLVAGAMATLGRPQVVLGHSFGGRIAVRLAAGWPELVSGLVLSGVPLFQQKSTPKLSYRMARWGHGHGLIPDSRMEKMRQRHGSRDYRQTSGVMRGTFVRLVNESYTEDLGRITCPVELVWGQNDTEAPPYNAERAAAALGEANGGARVQIIDGGGHMTPFSAPDVLRAAVSRLLRAGTP
jgi:pimeloyl-ACP methyl ester carboxylesterase